MCGVKEADTEGCVVLSIRNVQKRQIHSQVVDQCCWGREGMGVTTNGYGASSGGDKKVLELDSGDGHTTL